MVIYTKTKRDAKDLSYDPENNAGIDLFPDVSTIEVPDKDFVRVNKVSENESSVVVSYIGATLFVTCPYRFALPKNVHGIVFGRSGNFFKSGIDVFHGVIDSSYRGPIKVGLKFYRTGIFSFKNDVAVAQLVLLSYDNEFLKLDSKKLHYVEEEYFMENLMNTERQERGFGSSGHI